MISAERKSSAIVLCELMAIVLALCDKGFLHYLKDPVPFGTFLNFWVPIFGVLGKFTRLMSIQSACVRL